VTATASANVLGNGVKQTIKQEEQVNKTVIGEKTTMEQKTKTVVGEQKEPQRELGFS
jgi:hypothetical protein